MKHSNEEFIVLVGKKVVVPADCETIAEAVRKIENKQNEALR